MLIAVDTETNGVDFHHGCKPFFVSTCDELNNTRIWEWDVNPFTRQPKIPIEDIKEIVSYLQGHRLIFHNAKFDIKALASIQIDIPFLVGWENIEDTLVLSHILNSEEPHNLKYQAKEHLGIDIDDQTQLAEATKEARRKIKADKGTKWNLARKDHKQLPSLKGEYWVADSWIPKALAIKDNYHEDHSWYTLLEKYGTLDAIRTILLYQGQQIAIPQVYSDPSIFNALYNLRMDVLRITYEMECKGITLNPVNTQHYLSAYKIISNRHERDIKLLGKITNVRSYPQLSTALYKHLGAPVLNVTEKGQPSTDNQTLLDIKDTLQTSLDEAAVWEIDFTLREERKYKKLIKFIDQLMSYRKSSKAVQYIEGYQTIAVKTRLKKSHKGFLNGQQRNKPSSPRVWTLYPSFNITGTRTTRFSSKTPNAQNISKQEDYNLRKCFGPIPGRYWLAADYSNIEMRIFAYCSGSKDLIEAFERGEAFHMVIANILHPDEVEELGEKKFKKTENYRKVKNGNFSLIYGAGKKKADVTYGVPGAYDLIRSTLTEVSSFMRDKAAEAESNGYITTLGGYQLQVPSDRVYAAVNYFVQGSAGWIMHEAMVLCHDYLQKYIDHHLIMQVHDELVFDFPLLNCQSDNKKKPSIDQILVDKLKQLMEDASESLLEVVVPVEYDIIHKHWGE